MKRRTFIQGGSTALASVLAGCGGGGGGSAAATDLTDGALVAPTATSTAAPAAAPGAPSPVAGSPASAAPTATPPQTPVTPASTGQVPILTDNQLVADAKWTDPCVIAEDGRYTMWSACGVGFTGVIRVFRLRSTDRVNWTLSPSTPVLQATAGAWDQSSVETPSVVYFNGQYHMFYTGYTGPWSESKNYRIGHAVSPDGITWTKDPSYLLGPTDPANTNPTLDFRQWVCAEPGAVVFNNKLYLYFTAIGANAQIGDTVQTIGLSTLDAGGTWSAPQQVLVPHQSVYPRSACYGFSTPAACVRNGQVQLFFSVVQATPWAQVAIGNAVSADGMNGWRLNTLPVINRDAAWRSAEVLAPAAVSDAAGTHLWFGGNNGSNLGIGYIRLA